MYNYKREINNIKDYINKEYVLSNNNDLCLSLSSVLANNKPYHGLYIKNGKVLISNFIENIEVKNVEYKISDYIPSRYNKITDEFINLIDLDNNLFSYKVNKLSFSKKIIFEDKSDKLCIEYDITNDFDSTAHFIIKPVITYRDIFTTKNASMLKFNQRKLKDGVLVNLSIVDQTDLVMKSNEFSWTKCVEYINDIETVYSSNKEDSKKYVEDLATLGEFDIAIKPKKSQKAYIYISTNNFNIDEMSFDKIYEKNKKLEEMQISDIENEFVELKDMVIGMNKIDFKSKLITTLPYNINNILDLEENEIDKSNITNITIKNLTDIVKSIDGQYLTFNKVKEAILKLIQVRRYIKEIDMIEDKSFDFLHDFVLLKLWYIESVNKILQKEEVIDLFFDFTKEMIYFVFNNLEKDKL